MIEKCPREEAKRRMVVGNNWATDNVCANPRTDKAPHESRKGAPEGKKDKSTRRVSKMGGKEDVLVGAERARNFRSEDNSGVSGRRQSPR